MYLQRTCLQCSIYSSQLWRFKNAFILSLILEKVNLQHQNFSSLVNGHFTGNTKVEFTSSFNEMFPKFCRALAATFGFPVKVFPPPKCDNTNLHCDNAELHCLGLISLLSTNQNCEIFSCILSLLITVYSNTLIFFISNQLFLFYFQCKSFVDSYGPLVLQEVSSLIVSNSSRSLSRHGNRHEIAIRRNNYVFLYRRSFLKPFNKLAARVLSGPKPLGLRPRGFKPDKTLLLVY